MKNLVAILKSECNLDEYADAINNRRADGIYFYVNGKKVSVSYPYSQLSEEMQLEELRWFLDGREYEIN
jgi:hypothetical protein